MVKTITQRLIERQKKEGGPRKNLADFLANKDQIQKAISQGFSARAVWELLHEEGSIQFNYNTFCRYLNKSKMDSSTSVIKEDIKTDSADAQTPVPASQKNQGFKFNPTADKKDLL